MTIGNLERSLQKTTGWIQELQQELGWENENDTYLALKSVLHALRDRLTPDEAADLAAQLPLVLKGAFYDGWKPGATPVKVRKREEFLRMAGEPLLQAAPDADLEHVTRCVFRVLDRRVTPGEIDDVRQMLPEELRELWPREHGAAH